MYGADLAGENEYMADIAGLVRDHPGQNTVGLHALTYKVVDSNRKIRTLLYGENPPLIAEAEFLRIVNTSDFVNHNPLFKNGTWEYPSTQTDTLPVRVYSGKVLSVTRIYTETYLHIKVINETFKIIHADVVIDGIPITANLLFAKNDKHTDPSFSESVIFEGVLKKLRAYIKDQISEGGDKNLLWKSFHMFKESFIWVQYPYACSIHRVQGMTADNVFFNIGELRDSSGFTELEANSLAYVALTRASKRLGVRDTDNY